MALVRRRRFGLGAYDAAAWADYQERMRTGQGYIPNAVLEDPNGGKIHFDSNGEQDYYEPPPQVAGPTDNLPATNDPNGTFYGWTRYEQAAYNAARGATGQIMDMVRASAVLGPGGVMQYDPAVIAESDRQLRAFAASSSKIQAALNQPGGFKGTAGQAAYDANEALAITNQAKTLLTDWLAFRDNMIRQNPANASLPIMPPLSHLPPMPSVMSPAVYDEIKRLVAAMPQPAPIVAPMTTTVSAPTVPQQTSGGASSSGGGATYSAPGFPSGGGGYGGGYMPVTTTGAEFSDANPDAASAPMPSGGGFDMGGGAGSPGGSAPGVSALPLGLIALAGAAFLFMRKR